MSTEKFPAQEFRESLQDLEETLEGAKHLLPEQEVEDALEAIDELQEKLERK